MKTFSKNNNGEIHFGDRTSEGFVSCNKEEAEKALKNLGNKKLWRCTVCNDLHIGEVPPKQCPTCYILDVYVEINKQEFIEMTK
jgi:rubrerythrin